MELAVEKTAEKATSGKVEVNKSKPKKATKKVAEIIEQKKGFPKLDLTTIDKAFEISTNEEEEAYIAILGSSLRKIDPSFDSRTYGFKTLTKLFESLTKYKVVKNEVNGLNHPIVRLR
jgi:hypothetical protein